MAMITYGRITDRLIEPLPSIAENKETENSAEVSGIPNDAVVPVSATITNQPIRESLSMLSENVDWSQVAACVSSKANCVCYGHKAQRLNIVPDTCNAAITYGWIATNKL
ncbi:hypothetical protein [Nitrosomonas sp. Nm84]|uniref:hypothetical protein n=1 Tax=Nitrosomonas sp. Nm84 TaxID=200124 RepID=UPI0021ABD19C|nr:hypothetical protein [Nitrosomonas sp. Nm84]